MKRSSTYTTSYRSRLTILSKRVKVECTHVAARRKFPTVRYATPIGNSLSFPEPLTYLPVQDIIISMVPEGSHVKSVYLTEHTGVLASSDLKSKILLDCSTIDVDTSLAVRDAVAAHHPNATFYDSPVSGGALGAQKSTLTFMLGAANDDPKITLLTRLLGLMGSNIFPCGGPSFGLTAKLCNNYCSGLIAIAVSEAMNIGMASGMDPRVLANVFHTSTAQSAICDDWCPVPGICPEAPASKGYRGGFRVQLMEKDFGLATESAKRVGVDLALGEQGLKV